MRGNHLVKEMAWFNEHRQDLLTKHRGKWVVVYNEVLVGIFDNFKDAYTSGIAATKSRELLVKQILEKESPMEISINITHGLLYAPTST
jgi:hypothetical protein